MMKEPVWHSHDMMTRLAIFCFYMLTPAILCGQDQILPPKKPTSESVDEQRADARRSKDSVASLTAALASTDRDARLRAVMALGGKGPAALSAIPALEKLLRAHDLALRVETAIALAGIGPDARATIASLETLLKDESPAVRIAAAEALRSVRWQLLAPCRQGDIPASVVKNGKSILLNIAPRDDAPEHPPEGWCGEVAIQEALLYHGAYFPQKAINAAGEPEHPDLYSAEIPDALKNLHAEFRKWIADRPREEPDQFLAWIRRQIAGGWPVLVGVKINPTEHEDWSLDHFSLVVGTTDNALLVNTTWGYRQTDTDRQLGSTQEGFSFKNQHNRYYGICIKGIKREAGSLPVRLFVLSEGQDTVNVLVTCEDLIRGRQYAVYKSPPEKPRAVLPTMTFEAKDTVFGFYDRVDRNRPVVYRCDRQGM